MDIELLFFLGIIFFLIMGLYSLIMIFVHKHNTKQRYKKAINREIIGDLKGALEILLTCQTEEKYVIDKLAELSNKLREENSSRSAQTVVYGDVVGGDKSTKTEIKDSVINKSNIGSDKD